MISLAPLVRRVFAPRPALPARSPHWPKVRHTHLLANPYCFACGGSRKVEVHHIEPYHLRPELELVPENLLSLCESETKCHLLLGHLGDWHNINTFVIRDAREFRDHMKNPFAKAA